MAKRRITVLGLLRLLNDVGDTMLPPMSIRKTYSWFYELRDNVKSLDEYFPSVVEKSMATLLREGWVEERTDGGATVVRLTETGKSRLIYYDLYRVKPKTGRWDGKWRLVYFDIKEAEKRRRDVLRRFLVRLGAKQLQQSVWISPFDVVDEVKYVREVLEIPHVVKLALVEEIENESELRGWFGI